MANLGFSLIAREFQSPRDLARMAMELEAAGADHLFVSESGNDSLAMLGGLAVCTRTAKLGTAITNIYLRHPYVTAAAAADIDNLSGGRLVLGLGTGHESLNTQYLGIGMDRPFSRMRDYLATVRRALDSGQSPIRVHNENYMIAGANLAWPAARKVPVILAALGERMAQLGGSLGDGVVTSLATLDQIRHFRAVMDDAAQTIGRHPQDVKLYAVVHACIRPNRDWARALVRTGMGYSRLPFYQKQFEHSGVEAPEGVMDDATADSIAIAGPIEYAAERVAEYREAGADVVLLAPVETEPDRIAAYRALLPLLKK